jgi:poly(3-hydroxybutyrate) depolymerase
MLTSVPSLLKPVEKSSVPLLLALLLAAAQPADRDSTETIVAADGASRTYRVFVPQTAGKPDKAPAVVLYNGSGSRVDALWEAWKPVARKDGIVLLGPAAFAPGAWRIPEDSPDFTRDVVEAAKAMFPIDPRRVYLFGHSGGGHHVLQVGLLESEYFAGVAAHAGALVPSFFTAIEKAPRKIPIGLWIGTEDQVVPIRYVRDTYDALRRQGYTTKLTELRGHTHSFAERSKETVENAWEFLSKAKLAADPVYQPYKFR